MKEKSLSRRERRKLQTRQQLKEATVELLIEIGFDALSIQKITDRADLARATFYLHFGDVEEAVWAVLTERFTTLVQVMWDVPAVEQNQRRYQKWVNLFSFIQQERDLMAVVMGDKGHVKLVRQISDFMAASLQSDLENGRAARTTTLPIPFEAQFYTGAVMQTVRWWLESALNQTPEQLAAMMYEIVLREPFS